MSNLPSNRAISFSESFKKAWFVKTIMTAYTFAVTLFIIMIAFPLFYRQGLLLSLSALINVNPVYVFAIGYFLGGTYAAVYPQIAFCSWRKDRMFRNQIIYPISLISVAILMVYVKGEKVGLKDALVVEILGRQLLVFLGFPITLSLVLKDEPNAMLVSPEGKLIPKKVIGLFLMVCVINLILSLLYIVLLGALILPISLSFLDLSELERAGLYGLVFPFVRYVMGYVCNKILPALGAGGNTGIKEKDFLTQVQTAWRFMLNLAIALHFSLSPMFCMLLISSTPSYFAISYIPHAFFSKLLWARNIPQIKKITLKIKSKFKTGGKLTVNPIAESNLSEEEIMNKKKEEERKQEEEKEFIGNTSTLTEASDLCVHTMAILLLLLRLFQLCFLTDGTSTNFSIDADVQEQFTNLLINCFCIILPIDQICGVLGFMLLERNGIHLHANFQLDVNPLNPYRTLKNVGWYKTVGSLSMCLSGFLCVCCGVAIGIKERLF